MRGARSVLACAAVSSMLAAGCDRKPRPWDDADASAAPSGLPGAGGPSTLSAGTAATGAAPAPLGDAAPAEPAGASSAPRTVALDGGPEPANVTDAGAASAVPHDAGHDAGEAGEPEVHPPVRVGGPWVRCYGNFRVSGAPIKDVTRLSLLCGPENGMRRLSAKPVEGSVTQGAAAFTAPLGVRRGECYRIFAVAEPSVADLDVTVRSSRGTAVASDHGEDPWPVVQPDRPFCALYDDTLTVEVSARRGRGRFAYEVWVLR